MLKECAVKGRAGRMFIDVEPARIVTIHLNQIGDLLFSLPALYNLRHRFPNAAISSVVRPSCAELLDRSNLVNETVYRPKGSILSDIKIGMELSRDHYDLLLLFSTSFATWLIAQASRARFKAGFDDLMHGAGLDLIVPWSPPPSTANNLRLSAEVGCEDIKSDYVGLVHTREEDRESAAKLLSSAGIAENERFVVLSAGTSTGREIKCWSDDKFALTAERLWNEAGLESVIVGASGGERIARFSPHVVDLTGKTSLPVLAAVLERSGLFIGVDSGVMHLAAAMGARVIGLFGPTDASATGPQGDGHVIVRVDTECSPCRKSHCEAPRCMSNISVDDVMQAIPSDEFCNQ